MGEQDICLTAIVERAVQLEEGDHDQGEDHCDRRDREDWRRRYAPPAFEESILASDRSGHGKRVAAN
jgi:hypothetical protein